jgi:hypothetical protein
MLFEPHRSRSKRILNAKVAQGTMDSFASALMSNVHVIN